MNEDNANMMPYLRLSESSLMNLQDPSSEEGEGTVFLEKKRW
jgi:hypothetical protein